MFSPVKANAVWLITHVCLLSFPPVVQGRKIVAMEKKRMPGCGVQNKHV